MRETHPKCFGNLSYASMNGSVHLGLFGKSTPSESISNRNADDFMGRSLSNNLTKRCKRINPEKAMSNGPAPTAAFQIMGSASLAQKSKSLRSSPLAEAPICKENNNAMGNCID
ncbi:hypothetical protein M405DRAFT_844705 [Rhizopogon salebrosus TDB-379]|nr:hypothetical protein M405DRAFT_844705 [Rhizopogon salebrosus TDB-379]